MHWIYRCAGNICYNHGMVEQALFLGCGLAVFGLILSIAGMIQTRIPLESLRWPTVEGEIVQAGSGDLRYRYEVREKAYFGSRVSFRSPGGAPDRRYPVGTRVKVYHDPTRPDRAVLEPGAGMSAYIFIGAGGLLFVIGLIAGLFAFV